jgi:hypothetical protein
MALPAGGKEAEWPPRDIKPYIDQAKTAQAWWSGNVDDLKAQAGLAGDTGRRRFWQRRNQSDKTKATAQLHAPLAADIAAVSADLLFGDPVGLNVTDKATQAELEYLEEALGLANAFAEGAEYAAASGGVYLRCAWDDQIADHALLQLYDQTHAVPDFRYGRLVAVSLWEDVLVEGGDVWRHLERHEPGRILHGLYKGTKSNLGTPSNLMDHPTTADLDPEVVLTGRLAGRLLVDYVPNVRPNRLTPIRPIGRPDWAGQDTFLDSLDESWTSLMRDVRLGQAHVFVPQEWLQAAGGRPGQTTTLDIDTEIFTGLNVADATEQKMDTYQAELRVTEHLELVTGLTERIVSACGYSPQTFGLQIDGSASSGTALRIREGKTSNTRSKKQRYWQPALRSTTQTLLDIGAEVFHRPTVDPKADPVTVAWPELQRDPAEQATWIQTLRTAQAMSIDNAVKAAQPDLDEVAVGEEVARIKAESAVADPFPVG